MNNKLLVILAALVVVFIFFKSREKDEGTDKPPPQLPRVGVQYNNRTNDVGVNTFMTSINQTLDSTMKAGCVNKSQTMTATLEKLPATCKQAFQGLPMAASQFKSILTPIMCNADDTVNKPRLTKFLSDLGSAVCPY